MKHLEIPLQNHSESESLNSAPWKLDIQGAFGNIRYFQEKGDLENSSKQCHRILIKCIIITLQSMHNQGLIDYKPLA